MVGKPIRILHSLPVAILLAGSLQAAGTEPGNQFPGRDTKVGTASLPEAESIQLSTRSLLPPPGKESPRAAFPVQMFQELSLHLQEETGRDTLQNTQAFLSALNPAEDSHLEELRSQRAEALLSKAMDEYLDDQLDRLLEEVRVLHAVASFLDRVSDYDLNRLWKRDRRSAAAVPAHPVRPDGADGDVRLLIDLHPKLRLQGSWRRFNGRLDLPLSGDDLRLRIQREIAPGFSAQLESTYRLNGEDHLTTLGFVVVF